MSENIENTIQKEDMPDTQEAQTSQLNQEAQDDAASAAGSNVVPYPVSDKQKHEKNEPVANPANAQNIQQNNTQNNTQNDPHRNEMPDSSNSEKSRSTHYEGPDDTEDLEEDFYEQQEKFRSKDEHPFREFFSNFRSKRKIEMNRDEQILSRISDDDLMEYLRMEQKRMELLQQAKEVR